MKNLFAIGFMLVVVCSCPAVGEETTRADYERFCQGHVGRWAGEISSVINQSIIGAPGETYAGYWEGSMTEDGNAFAMRFMGPKTSNRGLCYFDPAGKKICITSVNSEGVINQHQVRRHGDHWMRLTQFTAADGTRGEMESVITMDGNTITVVINGELGDRVIENQKNIWHRVSK
ncbi:MAG: hypothetical protein P8N76_24000 [Pirellulaceae bacterium]|nr:hypothetical protein [Pirellulaceae bacterium]